MTCYLTARVNSIVPWIINPANSFVCALIPEGMGLAGALDEEIRQPHSKLEEL